MSGTGDEALRPGRRALLGALALVLAGCSMTPRQEAMRTQRDVPARPRPLPGAVLVTIGGERDRTPPDGPWIPAPDFKAAVVESLARARVFERVTDGADARYALSGQVVALDRPMVAINAEFTAEVAWSLVDRGDADRPLLRKVIRATGRATVADAFGGVARARMALEATARASIDALIAELAALPG